MNERTITPPDELLHPVGEGAHWQESWYFNWSDHRRRVFGLARIGFNFRQERIDGLVLTIRDGGPEFIYPAVHIPFRGDGSELSPSTEIRAQNLVFRMIEPLKKWRLQLYGRNRMDLEWEAFTPVFDYRASEGELPPNVTGEHFEQSGRVRGWTDFKGRRLEIDGTGQRDKSWGVRDWAHVEGWDWISAQFGDRMAFNAWQGSFEGRTYRNGFVHLDGVNVPVSDVAVEYRNERVRHVPVTFLIRIVLPSGRTIRVEATTDGHFPLVKNGLWIQESKACFRAEIDGAGFETEGHGVIEHAWHAGTAGVLKRFPTLLRTAVQVLT